MSLQDILTSAIRRKSGNGTVHLPAVIPTPVHVVRRKPEPPVRKALITTLRRLEFDATVGPRAMNVGDILTIVACGNDLDELPDLALAMFANGFAKNIGQEEPVLLDAFKNIRRIDGRSVGEILTEC